MANSLVGTIIIAVMLLASCTVPKILFIRGNKNAAVLPVPVCADAIISLPFKMCGITCS